MLHNTHIFYVKIQQKFLSFLYLYDILHYLCKNKVSL